MFSPRFKAKPPQGTGGIWTPKNQTPSTSTTDLRDEKPFAPLTPLTPATPPPPPPPAQPIWTPQPSPTQGRREFRPIRFESPTLPRRYVLQPPTAGNSSNVVQPPWSSQGPLAATGLPPPHQQPVSPRSATSCTNLTTPTSIESGSTNTFEFCAHDVGSSNGGYGGRPTGVSDKIRTFERSASASELSRPFRRLQDRSRPAYRPNEVIYKVQQEYMSEPETEYDKPRKMAQIRPRQYDGIGPTTNDGMPIILRSEVKAPHQHEWYKRLYQTIHKQKNGEDYVIRYKCPRGRNQYKSSGYQSEPEPSYPSSLDRRRLQTVSSSSTNVRGSNNNVYQQDDKLYGSMPNPIKSGQSSYKNQPGRIEDYVTGHSSVSEKERKEWWDEVMDIFNGHWDQQKLSPHYTEGNLSRALAKESGYTSDSNLVFRKKEIPVSSPLSPVEQKVAYKQVQAGGEPPLFGFRKPAPEKSKEREEEKEFREEFECLQVTPTLTKIRVNCKAIWGKNPFGDQDNSDTEPERRSEMFTQFPKSLPTFIPLKQEKPEKVCSTATTTKITATSSSICATKEPKKVANAMPAPPKPPNRKSSCSATRASGSQGPRRPASSRHHQCYQSNDDAATNKYGTITLRKHGEPILRSKSTGAVAALLRSCAPREPLRSNSAERMRIARLQQHIRLRSVSPSRCTSARNYPYASSSSPVAFGRSISKERTFAEEKKRLENTLPLKRSTFEASTNILRDPSLRSPQDVKKAVRSYATCNVQTRSKSLPRINKPSCSVNMQVKTRYPAALLQQLKVTTKTSTTSTSRPPPPRTVFGSKTITTSKSSGNLTKCVSTVSLARTNSTYSLLSTMSKEKEAVEKRAKESAKKVQKSPKSDSGKAKPSKPETIYSAGPSSTRKSAEEEPEYREPQGSVRDKALFWDDFNAQLANQKANLKPCKYGATHHNSRSLSPMRRAFVRGDYEDQDIYEYINQDYQYAAGAEQSDVWQNGQVDEYGSENLSHSTGSLNDLDQGERGKRKFSPTREVRVPQKPRQVRSPSRRKIDSCRVNNASRADSSSRVIRASSLSSADDRAKRCANTFGGPDGGGSLYMCGELAHSATSLGGYADRHSPTCRYRKNCDRFTDLNRFYNTLERVGQLERTTSSTSFKPIRKESELLDFNEWRKVRLHERAEKELHYLVSKLKDDQRHKDVVYRAKYPDEIKWRQENDYTLNTKDKSVEDLREAFEKRRDFSFNDYGDQRDFVRPYWRRNTVADLAYSLEHRNLQDTAEKPKEPAGEEAALPQGHLSKRLVSTLSKEQIVKISKQLNEIYSNKSGEDIEDYVVNVDKAAKPSVLAAAHALKVRCNSSITKNDLLKPVMKRKEFVANPIAMSEASKTEEPFTGAHTAQCNLEMAKETRGAIAAKKAERTLPSRSSSPIGKNDGTNVISIQVPYTPRSKEQSVPTAPNAPLTPAETATKTQQIEVAARKEPPELPARKDPDENISSKIKYFEDQQFVEPPKTIYHAREDSSPDEAEVMRIIEDNMKKRAEHGYYQHKEMSSSLTELNDLFGERSAARVNFHFHSPPPNSAEQQGSRQPQHNECMQFSGATYEMDGDMTPPSSMEFLNSYYRSRSLSPPLSQASSSHLCRVRTGEVQKIREQFESLQSQDMEIPEPQQFFGERGSLRRVRSDPEVPQAVETQTQTDDVAAKEAPAHDGAVSWITHKFETHNKSLSASEERSRPKVRIPQTVLKNRLMPHIDIISKRAALKKEMNRKDTGSPERSHSSNSCSGGFVERMRCQYESPCSQRRCLFSSNPDIHNLTAISEHLSADWIAHKYPSPTNNTQNAAQKAKQPSATTEGATTVKPSKREKPFRANSISPPRPPKSERHRGLSKVTSTLKPYYDDIFANQHFDPKIHQPKARYVPDGEAAAPGDPKKSNKCRSKSRGRGVGRGELSAFARKTLAVTFQDYDYAPPVPTQPPPRSYIQNGNASEEELALRQAEQMQRLYQEERRRKYLQELQDMNSRRHTDNFTPSQKSPIPLNRYDDFPLDVTLTNGSANGPKAIARALYNFNGQNARELTLKKGDIIYIRRQIDKNWYEGEHNASIGLFPANYVEIINKDVSKRPTTASLRKPSEGQARAKYNFQAQSGVELSLNKGELVTLTRRVDDNWFEGKIANRKGIFPVNYVEVLTDIGAEDIAAKTVVYEQSTVNLRPTLDMMRTNINNEFNSLTQNGNHPANSILKETKVLHKTDILHVDTSSEPIAYRALYKYKPQNSDELELLEGDLVQVLEKCDDGWFVGTSQRTGCFGTFPGNYVERA